VPAAWQDDRPGSSACRRRGLEPRDLDFRELTGRVGNKVQRTRIPLPEHRGVMIGQLQALLNFVRERSCTKAGELQGWRYQGRPLYYDTINMYEANHWVIQPLTAEAGCSYVEAVMFSPQAQMPTWFVSHWWGEPLAEFCKSIVKHAQVRGDMAGLVRKGLGRSDMCAVTSAYWICAFATDQRERGAAAAGEGGELEAAFISALRVCRGVLLVLDATGPATPFQRIWCLFESSTALLQLAQEAGAKQHLLDIAAVQDGAAQVITDGLTEKEVHLEALRKESASALSGWGAKLRREAPFPLEAMRAGLDVCVSEASATQRGDRQRILNLLAGREKDDLDAEPDPKHPKFADLDRGLRAAFASAAMRQAVQKRVDLEDDAGAFPAAKVLRADPSRAMKLDLGGCFQLQNEGLGCIARNLPGHLRKLEVNVRRCFQLSSLDALVEQLSRLSGLRELTIDCEECVGLSLTDIGEHLMKLDKLSCLRLNFAGCNQITNFVDLAPAAKVLREKCAICSVVGPDGTDLATPPPRVIAAPEEDPNDKNPKHRFTFSGWGAGGPPKTGQQKAGPKPAKRK